MAATDQQDGGTVSLLETRDDYNEYINQCFEDQTPALAVNMVTTRVWATVECDMLGTEGWKTIETSLGEKDCHAILTRDAVERVNEILQDYEDEELHYQGLTGALSTAHGANFMSFPGMRPEVAQRLADELKPVVENEDNWELRKSAQRIDE